MSSPLLPDGPHPPYAQHSSTCFRRSRRRASAIHARRIYSPRETPGTDTVCSRATSTGATRAQAAPGSGRSLRNGAHGAEASPAGPAPIIGQTLHLICRILCERKG